MAVVEVAVSEEFTDITKLKLDGFTVSESTWPPVARKIVMEGLESSTRAPCPMTASFAAKASRPQRPKPSTAPKSHIPILRSCVLFINAREKLVVRKLALLNSKPGD